MPCEWLRTNDGQTVHINRGRGGGKAKICPFCRRGKVSKLCDFPIGDGKTCDAEMCDQCCRTLGRQDVRISAELTRVNDTYDVCPNHRGTTMPKTATP